ncbi:response regulator [Sphingomonas paucimobilis]|uniref:DNA, contig: SP655 n=1 Tax=Sphingomonas paucimobilis NBRC 13935 TaxID=1219050 RepID=A0A0C9NGF6_SPHPI|nr:response regulator [Sphingomonas paucimobilis]MDG5970055.1 response regulator [Sphingomonas paucimobilis]QPS17888.1 response regulator [Sphingomonas paucimobilis]GAN15297.1 hypothetical protein SP6_55_00150 [Sphingomonas paucimobilis NBRC 13935]SUJ32773.1 two-component response regulator [Sphingomonas paucimobilis]|tara:strand:- start:606 stop:956 length:351 start_codon:yes stop_codon:yes gene_type:complete
MCYVLIIEDEWIIAEHLAGLAEDAGATSIEVAAIGRQTVEAARERRLDIILSDARLQEGTCPAAVASIQCELGDIPAIFITGSPTECQPRSASAIVLTKLFDNAAMLGVFRNSAPI